MESSFKSIVSASIAFLWGSVVFYITDVLAAGLIVGILIFLFVFQYLTTLRNKYL